MGNIVIDKERLYRLKNQILEGKQTIDYERLEFMKIAYEKYQNASPIILRAQFFAYLLDHKKIYIDENYFVGSLGGEVGSFYIYPEWKPEWLVEEDRFEIPEDKKEVIQWTYNYWKERSLGYNISKIAKEHLGIEEQDYVKAGVFSDIGMAPAGVSNSNYARVVEHGVQSIIDEAKKRLQKLEIKVENRDKFDFYQAVIIEFEALIRYANRYADLAEELAAKETNQKRKEELLEIAEITRWVPQYPARTFREGIQSHYFAHLGAELEQVGCGVSQGYFGQELEALYQKDLQNNEITAEEATYLLEHYFVKLNDISYYYGQRMDLGNSGDTAQTISIGGYTEDGKDATGEVDYLILDAQIDIQLPQPPLALIYHEQLQPKFIAKAFDLIKTGLGMPQFMNANVLIERSLDAYSRYGATIEDARRSCVYGCVSTAIPNKTAYLMEASYNLVKPLELVIYNGVDPLSGLKVGLETGEFTEFKTYDEIYEAYRKQLKYTLRFAHQTSEIYHLLISRELPLPIRSALTDGCLETGRDMWNDGSQFTATALVYNAGVDAGNSLAAIKKLVFDEKRISLVDLKNALENNFEGYEIIQQLLKKAPKHGNNDPYVENIIQKVYQDAFATFQTLGGNYFGKYAKPDAYSKTGYNYYGQLTGALPSGRNERTALTDGSVSATPGTDEKGPTVLVSSAATGIDTIAYNSAHLNVKLNPVQFRSEGGNAALLALIRGYFAKNGNHIQFNCVDADILRDAQIHPENHRDLVVRVAGFSAFFTRLHPGVQDEIIARTEQCLACG